jgi:hypothetical protein
MSNIEELLYKISNVPVDSNRTLRLIRELDLKLEHKVERVKDPSTTAKEKSALVKECLALQDEKIKLAMKLENIIKTSIDHLNEEIEITTKKINLSGQPIPESVSEAKPKKKKEKQVIVESQLGENREIYCFCRTYKEGNMIECDNPYCKFKWFHFDCVGISEAPDDLWFCKQCKVLRRNSVF